MHFRPQPLSCDTLSPPIMHHHRKTGLPLARFATDDKACAKCAICQRCSPACLRSKVQFGFFLLHNKCVSGMLINMKPFFCPCTQIGPCSKCWEPDKGSTLHLLLGNYESQQCWTYVSINFFRDIPDTGAACLSDDPKIPNCRPCLIQSQTVPLEEVHEVMHCPHTCTCPHLILYRVYIRESMWIFCGFFYVGSTMLECMRSIRRLVSVLWKWCLLPERKKQKLCWVHRRYGRYSRVTQIQKICFIIRPPVKGSLHMVP